MWSLSLITAAVKAPVDLDSEVRPHVRVEAGTDQEVLLAGAIDTARQNCETFTRRQLVTAVWELWLDTWYEEGIFDREYPCQGALLIPRPPLASIDSVTYLDTAGVVQTWAPASYSSLAPSGPTAQKGRLFPAYGEIWPSIRSEPGAIKVRFTCGYGSDHQAVPKALKTGMLLEIGEMYERRELASAGTLTPNVLGAERLWGPFRVW